jgi:lysophospholipase L1-like esterase
VSENDNHKSNYKSNSITNDDNHKRNYNSKSMANKYNRDNKYNGDSIANAPFLSYCSETAMGGAGSAYRWARHNPPLMARDLIHFTVPGYQRLAQLMAKDLGWGPDLFGDVSVPAVNR